ncbi:M3 family metallopeptidase [Candidatus Viadribacter manganicus]|uniref:Peptidase M3 n=1 Tax=Candidatus Viadribacter manganicus TaxID=1759059 RepID=A0A1B1AH81_9PROT|nr:M3 family metallopeptidase [Candidatus Viadribacter manganicus]ANP45926.1 peptidase M3 [Candidatus Viadribacter manganicus]
MKKQLLAICLAASVPMLAACATTGADSAATFGNATAYQQAQTDVQRLTAQANQDPLLKPWTGQYGGVPPWDQARAELVPPALELGIQLQEAEVQVIANNPERPTFDNTIGAMQNSGRHLDRATTIFGVMTDNISNEAIQGVEAEWSPRLTAAYNAITFNRALFNRIHDLYERRESLGLNAHQLRLLERTHDQFVRAGAAATPEQQARLGAINEELSTKYADFGRRLLADENTAIFITNRRDLAGLPPNIVEALAAAATERGHAGQWAVVNTRSSVDPFLTFSSNRPLRQRVYTAFKNRGDNGDANDTNAVIADILRLRAERAQILGFQNHAYLRMADTMAGTPERAQDLMMRVWPAAVARVHEEVADMQAIANRQRANITIEPWDYNYYAEQVRRDRYNLDQNELRPYFELNNMINASMYMANQLYGLSFREITGTVPVFEPNVRVWEVTDRDGSFRGLFYGDYFARAGKRSGAWMNTYRSHETFNGPTITTLASNNNNFVRGGEGQPVLISLDDAETLFHEFGHAIHYLVSEVDYPGLGNVPRDYVEYPSQVHEHWVLSRPILDQFARHYQTNQPMPQALVDRVHNASTFNQGYATVEYLSSALVDMALHNRATPVTDVDAFERETLASLNMPREMSMRHRLPQFGHLFSSDAYSAGYYSYLWSETMDADTWEMFEATGNVFDPTVAAGMRNIILAPGNMTDRAEAYRQFRGRDPDVNALLRTRGFPTDAPATTGGSTGNE